MALANRSQSVQRPAGLTAVEEWFAALDHCRIGVGADSSEAEVLGIHPDGETLWVQVAQVDNPYTEIILHISSASTVDDVRAALAARSTRGESCVEIIDVL
jgi:hypothetical protein